jgi:hypothetical protein
MRLHLDHIGWTSDTAPLPNAPNPNAPSGLIFSRARHVLAEANGWRYWTTEAAGATAGPEAEAVIKLLEGVVEFVKSGDTIASGVTVEDASGRPPGHLAVVEQDPPGIGTGSAFIVGDLLQAPLEIADSNAESAGARGVVEEPLHAADLQVVNARSSPGFGGGAAARARGEQASQPISGLC